MSRIEWIYVARHAWAGHQGDPRWPNDTLRELELEGIDRYVRVVQTLAQRGFAPRVVATSPYVRCRQTAELIAKHTPHAPQVVALDALRPDSDFDELCAWSLRHSVESICWVGHTPDVGRLTAKLIGSARCDVRFAKGAVAAVRLDKKMGVHCGQLDWLATAKLLGL